MKFHVVIETIVVVKNRDIEIHPILLTDKNRLQEIYNLRVECWENSEQTEFVNKFCFPNGWKDRLDEFAYHWIIEYDNEIIASSRICIVKDLSDIDEDFSKFDLPADRPFAFYSRLVVHPKYRGMGIQHRMDLIRIQFLIENKIKFALATTSTKRRYDNLLKLGFKNLGKINHSYSSNSKIDNPNALLYNVIKNI